MIYRKVNLEEFDKLASIHKVAFSDFFLTSLGIDFLNRYYKSCLNNATSIAICAVDDDGFIKGFATGTSHAKGFHKRILLDNLLLFIWSILKIALMKPYVIIRLFRNMNKSQKNEDKANYAELLSIAVLPGEKGNGIGEQLLKNFELEVISRGVDRITLTTDYYNNERVLLFYKKCGYVNYFDFITYPKRRMYKLIKFLQR